MIRFNKICGLIVAMLSALTSCDSFFDKTGDGDAISAERFFSDESAYRNAMNDAYIQLRSPRLYGGTLTLTMLEPAAGTLEPWNEVTRAAARQDFTDKRFAAEIDSMQLAAYSVVAACNQVIAAANSDALKSSAVRIAVGEAHAMRAAIMLDLVRLLSPYPCDDEETLQQVSNDLDRAATLLKDSDPLLQSTNPTAVVGQMDRRLRTLQLNWYAVKALQARLALWQGQYEQALAAADSVFLHQENVAQRNQVFYFVQPGKYGSDFCFSREFVFGIATRPDGFPALSDRLFIENDVHASPRLRNIYQDVADIRYRAWFRQAADGQGYTMARKFSSETLLSGYVVSTTGGEMQLPASIPFIKLGEVALIAAEALNETGRTEEALQRIETLEQQKDAGSYAALLRSEGRVTREAVRQLIADEYERELFGEGQLFYFYKRSGEYERMLE